MRYFRMTCTCLAAFLICAGVSPAAPNGVLEEARLAQKRGDKQLASLYYFNAMANDRHSLDALKDYVAMIEQNAADADDPQSITNLYDSLQSLVQQQATSVEPELIPQLNTLIGELDERRKSALDRLEKTPDEAVPTAKDAMEGLKTAFASFIRNEGDAAELQNDLNEAIAAARVFAQDKKLRQMTDIAEQTEQKTLDQRAFAAALEQIGELLSRLERETDPEHFEIISSTIANGIAGLVLQKDKASPEQLADLKAAENKRKEIIRQYFTETSRKLAENMELLAGKIDVERGTATQKIERFAAHQAEIQKRAQSGQLTIEDAKRGTEAVQKAITILNEQRLKDYNRWALTNIDNALSSEYKKITNSGRSRILRDYFAKIDPRYLEPNVQRAYEEVFRYYYAQLNVAEKLSVDKALATAAKRKLEDF